MRSSKKLAFDLNSDGTYPCPVCRFGQISSLPLMDALACNFCQHIFTANLEKQQLNMPARQPPLIWGWNGKNWTGANLEGVELGWGYWVAAVVLVLLPTAAIGLSAYYLHPTPGTPLFWLPAIWTGLTFLSHLGIIGWLIIEIYQFPVETYLRVMRQHMLGR